MQVAQQAIDGGGSSNTSSSTKIAHTEDLKRDPQIMLPIDEIDLHNPVHMRPDVMLPIDEFDPKNPVREEPRVMLPYQPYEMAPENPIDNIRDISGPLINGVDKIKEIMEEANKKTIQIEGRAPMRMLIGDDGTLRVYPDDIYADHGTVYHGNPNASPAYEFDGNGHGGSDTMEYNVFKHGKGKAADTMEDRHYTKEMLDKLDVGNGLTEEQRQEYLDKMAQGLPEPYAEVELSPELTEKLKELTENLEPGETLVVNEENLGPELMEEFDRAYRTAVNDYNQAHGRATDIKDMIPYNELDAEHIVTLDPREWEGFPGYEKPGTLPLEGLISDGTLPDVEPLPYFPEEPLPEPEPSEPLIEHDVIEDGPEATLM